MTRTAPDDLPPRASSRFANDCADVHDRDRLERALEEAAEVLRASDDAEVRRARFELVVECAHRIAE
ncbi:MAG: hypothetical protein R3F34_15675, partial [Planctomycetota bacterium]